MKTTITLIASGSSFFPKVGCHIFFTLKSVDRKEIFIFPPEYIFFPPLWECYLENKSLLGNGRGKTIPVLLLTVHWLLLYQEAFSHHLYTTTASFFFLYCHRVKIRGDPTGAVLLVQILVHWPARSSLVTWAFPFCLPAFAFPRPVSGLTLNSGDRRLLMRKSPR